MQRLTSWVLASVLLTALVLGAAPRAGAEDGAAPEAAPAKAASKAAARRPLLWMVEGTPRVFLYGTIHVADERVTAHLPVVQAAFDQSDAVYTELRLDAQGMQQMQMAVMMKAQMPDRTLTDVLGEDLHGRVGKLVPPQIPFAMLQNMKPWLIQFILTQRLMQEHQAKRLRDKAKAAKAAARAKPEGETMEGSGGKKPGAVAEGPPKLPVALDPLLYAQASKAGKTVGGLETIDTQLNVFDSLSLEAQVKMVKELVEKIEKFQKSAAKEKAAAQGGEGEGSKDEPDAADEDDVDPMGKLVDMWLRGDDQGFLAIFEKDLRKQGGPEAEKFVAGLLDDRNVGMTAKIRELMKADPKQTLFIAVGAGHMPGEKGIVNLLAKEGLKVLRLELGEKLTPPAKPAAKAAGKPAEKKAPVGAGG